MTQSPEHKHSSLSELAEEARQDGERAQANLLKEAWAEAAGHNDESTSEEDALAAATSDVPPPAPGAAPSVGDMSSEVADLKDQLLRTIAETENVRRRATRDVEEAGKYAVTNFAREIVTVCDNLWRANAAIPEELRKGNDMLGTIAQGIDMTLSELMNVLERFHIKRIDPLGQPFDHNLHQAVVQLDSADAEPGIILQVMQAGYTLHGRLLRPAMVGVAKRPEAPPASTHVDTQA